MAHTTDILSYPHAGGCDGCRQARVCNVCASDIRTDTGRCTNGRCSACHAAVCSRGGETSPGHGFGVPFVEVDRETAYGSSVRLSRSVRIF